MALANVLTSAQVVEMGIYVVRAFMQLRQASAVHADLAKRLTELDALAGGIWSGHQGPRTRAHYFRSRGNPARAPAV